MNKIGIKYYRHKGKHDVVCEILGSEARFSKWTWKGGICSEDYTFKDVTKDFKNAFEEITQDEFNHVWGLKLQQA